MEIGNKDTQNNVRKMNLATITQRYKCLLHEKFGNQPYPDDIKMSTSFEQNLNDKVNKSQIKGFKLNNMLTIKQVLVGNAIFILSTRIAIFNKNQFISCVVHVYKLDC